MVGHAERLAGSGLAVLAADVWGEAQQPGSPTEIGPLIGGMVADRPAWTARIAAAHDALAAQPEVAADELATIGFCFGGSSALEHLRQGGSVRGVVSIHGGLDLLAPDWSAAPAGARVLVCTGAADPMATRQQRADLEDAMTGAGVAWDVHLYSGVKHAFTSPLAEAAGQPEVFAYDERAAAVAWSAAESFFRDLFALTPAEPHSC